MKAENTHSLKQLHEEQHQHQTPTIERWNQQDVVDRQVQEGIVRHHNAESGPMRNRAELIEKLKLEAAANVLNQAVSHIAKSTSSINTDEYYTTEASSARYSH